MLKRIDPKLSSVHIISNTNKQSEVQSKENKKAVSKKTWSLKDHTLKILFFVLVVEIIILIDIYKRTSLEGITLWSLIILAGFAFIVIAIYVLSFFIESIVDRKFDEIDAETVKNVVVKKYIDNRNIIDISNTPNSYKSKTSGADNEVNIKVKMYYPKN
jgi:hypothetical protein